MTTDQLTDAELVRLRALAAPPPPTRSPGGMLVVPMKPPPLPPKAPRTRLDLLHQVHPVSCRWCGVAIDAQPQQDRLSPIGGRSGGRYGAAFSECSTCAVPETRRSSLYDALGRPDVDDLADLEGAVMVMDLASSAFRPPNAPGSLRQWEHLGHLRSAVLTAAARVGSERLQRLAQTERNRCVDCDRETRPGHPILGPGRYLGDQALCQPCANRRRSANDREQRKQYVERHRATGTRHR